MKLIKRKKETEPTEPTEKPEVTIALVVFDRGYSEYGYKTILPVKVGDTVVAQVGKDKSLQIVRVIKINTKPDKKINYKWIVGIVDKDNMLKEHLKALKEYGIKE